MGHKKSRSVLVGVGAAAGAFGVAAMMSATTAATARADDFTDILNAVNGDFTIGQSEFTTAVTDFESNNFGGGLAAFFSGFDDDTTGAQDNLLVGTLDALTNQPVATSITFTIGDPGSFAAALTEAQEAIALGQTEFADALTALEGGSIATAVLDNAIGTWFATEAPAEVLFIGSLDSLGL